MISIFRSHISSGFCLLSSFFSLFISHLSLFTFSLLTTTCSSPIGEHHPEWKQYFDEYGVNGCIEIFDLNSSKFIDYNPDRCGQRFIPASTFKICNSLIALESKVVPDTAYVIKWDSIVRSAESWNRDQSMQEAFRHSAFWYYQEMSRRIGKEKYQHYLNLLHYGNRNPGGAVDSFWLTGDLRISADEQIEFLKNLYTEQLPLSTRSMELVKGMMQEEKNPVYTLSGKTGWGLMNSEGKKINIGWFVGFVEKENNVYLFALNIQAPEPAAKNFGDSRREITKKCLKTMGILE